MYVLNDVRRDSRVRREARALLAAGHEVTIMAVGETSEVDHDPGGFTIVRLPIPGGEATWPGAVRAPWRSVGRVGRDSLMAVRAGPPAWPSAVGRVATLALLLPWLLLRGAWVLIVNRLLRRPVRMGWLEYIRRWRSEILGWCAAAAAAAPVADVHHAHDMEALPAGLAAARRDRARLVYDSHEIFTAWGRILQQPAWLRFVMGRWERRMAGRADAVVTVNDAVAAALGRRLGVPRITVLHNCAPRWTPAEPEDRIRRAAGVGPDLAIVLCHGAMQPNRGLFETAEALLDPGLDRAHLVYLGYGEGYLGSLPDDPRFGGRLHVLPAVPADDVTAWVAGADVDVVAIGSATQNGRLSTPNKLFEAIAGGVPVVASDFPAMRSIVLDGPFGALGALCDPDRPASIAAAIRSILELDPPARAALRDRIRRAASERWNWETESERLVALYRELARAA